jgi:metal-sulfur cluster biosynthetic enzyme
MSVGSLPISEAAVREALREVIDPCSLGIGRPVNIVDLGLIDEVRIDGQDITIRLLLTDPACFFLRDLERYIEDVIRAELPVGKLRVDLVMDKLWIPKVTPLSRGEVGDD